MTRSKALPRLVAIVALAAIACAGAGLWIRGDGQARSFTTVRGDVVLLHGSGLYRNDSAFKAPILMGTDAVMLALGVPLLVLAAAWDRRGSLRGRLLLLGALAAFLYHAASDAFGVAYNELHVVYVVYFSASLFAFIVALVTLDADDLTARLAPKRPRRRIAALLFVSALSACVWLIEILGAYVTHRAPASVASYTTEATHVIDIGVIAPTAIYAGMAVLRRRPLGHPLAVALLVLLAMIGFIVAAQTAMQVAAGIALTGAQIAAYVVPFLLLSVISIAAVVSLLRAVRS